MKSRDSILRDCDTWPKKWMGIKEDVPYGAGIVEAMRPFIEALLDSGLAERTVQKHIDNLWFLGGEIIRDVSLENAYDKITPADKLRESIGPWGGPLCCHIYSEGAQQYYISTCRKLCRFLDAKKKRPDVRGR